VDLIKTFNPVYVCASPSKSPARRTSDEDEAMSPESKKRVMTFNIDAEVAYSNLSSATSMPDGEVNPYLTQI